ncbi:MAG: response regulator transcription factor [Pseudonocardia sp.]
MAHHVLLVEDDDGIVEFVTLGLGYEGFRVTAAGSVADALAVLRGSRPDLVVLDVMLPDRSGLDLIATMRASGLTLPVIIVSAQEEWPNRVTGLDAGADDYLTKPFRFEELLARIRAVMRRHHPGADDDVLACGPLRLDVGRHEVTVDGAIVEVTGLEFDLLELLLGNVGRVLTREVLMDRLWGDVPHRDSNVLEAHVSRLRRRLGPVGVRLIRTVRGVGYVLREPV